MANVVILEDNAEIASLYQQIFFQHQTRILRDIPEAIGYLHRDCPDLVIMDFHLPSGSGVDVLNWMRTQAGLKDVPVLGISVDDLLLKEAKSQGMNAFLTKPIEVQQLIDTAQKLISNTRKVPNAELRAALNEYATAYQAVYRRMPKGQWTGSRVLIDGHPCDERWLHGEARRLRSLVEGGEPRNYLARLMDKIRRL
jgi:CheY-like chemotaxis protein